MSPLFRNEERDPAIDYIYSETSYAGQSLESIRKDSFKLIRNRKQDPTDAGSYQLYDLSRDPHESVNLAAYEPAKVAALRQRLHDWSAASPATGPSAAPELDEEARESLRSVGYLE